jgi:hypothetical protein
MVSHYMHDLERSLAICHMDLEICFGNYSFRFVV